jgi:hypothetical protein
MPSNNSQSLSLDRALSTLELEVEEAKKGKNLEQGLLDLQIVTDRKIAIPERNFFNKNRLKVIAVIAFIYIVLILLATHLAIDKEQLTYNDPRSVSIFLTKLLDWLFVAGPQATQVIQGNTTRYYLESREIMQWIVNILISLIGWGAVISIPTILIDNFMYKAGIQDENLKAKIREQEEIIARAKIRGRLAVDDPSYNAFFTSTYDPLIPILMKGLHNHTDEKNKPWILVQTGDQLNKMDTVIADHIYIPDLASNDDFNTLLRAQRLSNNTVLVLTEKPGFKFLSNPEDQNQIDLSLSEIVVFIENIRDRAENVRFIVCGSPENHSLSASFTSKSFKKSTTLADVCEEIQAKLIDPDEIVIEKIFENSKGKPVFIEFTGWDKDKIGLLQQRLRHLLERLEKKYPLKITDEVNRAEGGIYFFGEDVEGVALARKTTNSFPENLPHYIIFEHLDRFNEVEALGFQPFCIDYELSKAILNIYFSQK